MSDLMAQALDTFISESLDLLQDMETSLQLLETEPANSEAINSIFRAAHTIKGSAGMFGLDDIVAFTHEVENVLERVRGGNIPVTGALIEALLQCRDHSECLIEQIGRGEVAGAQAAEFREKGLRLLEVLNLAAANQASPALEEVKKPTLMSTSLDGSHLVENDNWHISLSLHQDVFRDGLDPASFLRYLSTLGTVVHVETWMMDLPLAEEMDPESCYLGFEVMLASDADKRSIMEVFEFFGEQSKICVRPPHRKLEDYAAFLERMSLEDEHVPIGEMLVRCGALTESELASALRLQQQLAQTSPKAHQYLGDILQSQQQVTPQILEAALVKQKEIQEHKRKETHFIRVDAERLDQLIDLVGELVIAGAGTNELASQLHNVALLEATELTTRLVEEIRDISLSLRMVPVGETFKRFNRVVREIANDLGKDIRLNIEGGETELDKSVVEKIGDPLTHLIRNAIDHGIETQEIRAARGKSLQGLISLKAYHDSGNIVIEVRDDGAGMDPDNIFAIALKKGLVTEGQRMSRQDIYLLILAPGFSTKTEISELSGRGVGMDVVKRNVEALRGSIEVDSQLGHGTCFSIRLPLTLSIIEGFMVGIGSSIYVIPLDFVVECIEHASDTELTQARSGCIYLRGEVLPCLNLRHLFDERQETEHRNSIVLVQCGKQKVGLMVDVLLGEYQTVIKPLSKVFAQLSGISGSTILGSGEVAMILDVAALIKQTDRLLLTG
jgi:two-component system, chemotaxis family, sensor kinase CheA